MKSQQTTIETWDTVEAEDSMAKGHEPSWAALISHMTEINLDKKDILDFGCNRGGFLKNLYQEKPYHHAVGVDIAEDSIAFANANKENVPCRYDHISYIKNMDNAFDIVFSHEVIYLLPDLKLHAQDIHRVLKNNGVYYLAIGEYEENELWPRWKSVIETFSPVPPQTYSLKDIATCFHDVGFDVSVRRLICDGFFNYDPSDTKYIKTPTELINFMTRDMILFRLVKT